MLNGKAMKLIFLIITLLSAIAPKLHNISKVQENVQLNTFTKLPKDIQGCACYFYLSKSDENKSRYIMAENNADPAYISINGKMQKFKLVKFKNDLFYLYSNGTYTLKVEFT